MEKLSRYLWSTLLFVYSSPTKNSAVDSLCQCYGIWGYEVSFFCWVCCIKRNNKI